MAKPVILTGLRANSEFHLGNYLGGILPMIELQKKKAGECQINMFIPDLHSFTTPTDHNKLYGQTLENLGLFVAAGLDINGPDTFIYRQSYIQAHSELTWILGCFTGFGELARMTQFKDKSHTFAETEGVTETKSSRDTESLRLERGRASAGIFTYPVLMAADILLYGAEWVPVGDDQRQHLELTRDLAIRLNNKFGTELFKVPHEWNKQLEFVGLENGVRIRSLRNPDKKMSKSIEDPAGTILLSDKPEEAARKIVSATTDDVGAIHLDWGNQPGISNLLQISALLTERPLNEVAEEWEGKTSYGDLKNQVAEQVKDFISNLRKKYSSVDAQVLKAKLEYDEEQMRTVANATLLKVQQVVGLRPV